MSQTMPDTILSHWNNLVEGLQQSSNEFYTEVEQNLNAHKLKDVESDRVEFAEGGFFSARREYLQVRRGEHVYHVCAAPYGNGFFVSSWLGAVEGGFLAWLASFPFVGWIFRFFLNLRMTFYRIDTALAFQAVVHSAVLKALDSVCTARGIRALTERERTPVNRDFWDLLK
jgi:hypothetical protein